MIPPGTITIFDYHYIILYLTCYNKYGIIIGYDVEYDKPYISEEVITFYADMETIVVQ